MLSAIAIVAAAVLAVAVAQAGLEREEAPEAPPQLQQKASSWNVTESSQPDFDQMYRQGTRAPSFDHMFAKPRPKHF